MIELNLRFVSACSLELRVFTQLQAKSGKLIGGGVISFGFN
jgi:hypothetical protein